MSKQQSGPGNPLDPEELAAADAEAKARQEQWRADSREHAARLQEWRDAWAELVEASEVGKPSVEAWERLGAVICGQGYQQHAARVRDRLLVWLEATEGNGDGFKCPLSSVTGLRRGDPTGYRKRIEGYAVVAKVVCWAADDIEQLERMTEPYQRRVTAESLERVREEIERASVRPIEPEKIEQATPAKTPAKGSKAPKQRQDNPVDPKDYPAGADAFRRDAAIFRLIQEDWTNEEIMEEIERQAAKENWEPIYNGRTIRKRVAEYCAYTKQQVPKRKGGRPTRPGKKPGPKTR